MGSFVKKMIRPFIPYALDRNVAELKSILSWRKRHYLDNSPQIVKEKIFLKYGVPNAPWVETGTHLGHTTAFLCKHYPKIYSIEPEKTLFNQAKNRFINQPVELFNDTSEKVFPTLLPKLNGEINFWLDGHYSAGETFKGPKECPITEELSSISDNLSHFSKISILIDDVRCFVERHQDYPELDYLVDWARNHSLGWRIEHDIFIIQTQ